jgi:plasmid stabilization system protein ParE
MPETYRIIFSPRASGELQDILRYVAGQSPQNAALVGERILREVQSLKTFPGRFRVERRVRKLGYVVHSMVVLSFIVFYRILEDDKVVRILCIQRGARRRPRGFE